MKPVRNIVGDTFGVVGEDVAVNLTHSKNDGRTIDGVNTISNFFFQDQWGAGGWRGRRRKREIGCRTYCFYNRYSNNFCVKRGVRLISSFVELCEQFDLLVSLVTAVLGHRVETVNTLRIRLARWPLSDNFQKLFRISKSSRSSFQHNR